MSSFNPKHRNTSGGQISIALYRITQAIDFLLRERGKVMRLSPAQIQTLLFLKYAHPGVCTIGVLADRLGVTYATSSGIADALESKHLIRRVPLPKDQRVITLRLTPQGESRAEMLEDILDEIEFAVNSLPDTEQAVLLRATQAIVRYLQNAGYVKVYEMCGAVDSSAEMRTLMIRVVLTTVRLWMLHYLNRTLILNVLTLFRQKTEVR